MDDVLRILQRATDAQNRVAIIYESDGVFSERTIKPEFIRDGNLRAYCYLRKRKRTFVITKILSAYIIPVREKG